MQGLLDFAVLLEQAEPHHRDRILAQAEKEDPELVYQVTRKMIYFHEIIYLDESVLAEILSKTSPKVLAWALRGLPKEFRDNVLRHLGYREMHAVTDEEERMEHEVTDIFVLGARKQVLKIARDLEAQGKFNLELAGCPRLQKPKKNKKA